MCSFVYVGCRHSVLSPRPNVLLVKTMHSEFLFPRREWSWDQRVGNCGEGGTLSPWAWYQYSHEGWTQSGPLRGFSCWLDVWNEIFNLEQKSLWRDFVTCTMYLPSSHHASALYTFSEALQGSSLLSNTWLYSPALSPILCLGQEARGKEDRDKKRLCSNIPGPLGAR